MTVALFCKGFGQSWYRVVTAEATYEASIPDGWTLWGITFPIGWEPVTIEERPWQTT